MNSVTQEVNSNSGTFNCDECTRLFPTKIGLGLHWWHRHAASYHQTTAQFFKSLTQNNVWLMKKTRLIASYEVEIILIVDFHHFIH